MLVYITHINCMYIQFCAPVHLLLMAHCFERKTELTNDIEQNRGNFLMLCKSAHFVWYVVAAVSSISNESIKYSWHPGI